MNVPAWTVKLAAAAMIPAMIGMGVAVSAPSPTGTTEHVSDEAFEPGADGIDYASITGPKSASKVPACADPERRGDLRPCL